MFGRATCGETIVEVTCSPGDINLITTSSYFFMQCIKQGVRFEIWTFDPHVGDLIDTGSFIDFVCPGDSLEGGWLRLFAKRGPGRMTVRAVELGAFVEGTLAAEDVGLAGWFNVREE